jgi:hypothetical protein
VLLTVPSAHAGVARVVLPESRNRDVT